MRSVQTIFLLLDEGWVCIDGLFTFPVPMTAFSRYSYRSFCCLALWCGAVLLLSGCRSEIRLETPREVVDTANDLVLSYKIQEARDLLLNHEHLFPDAEPLRPDFQYILSLSLLHSIPPERGLIERAEVDMVDMAETYPDHPRAPAAWLYVGRMRDMRDYSGDEPRLPEAREAYERVLERYPDSVEAGEAAARLAITFMKRTEDQREDFAKGAELLAGWLDDNPDTEQASSLSLFLANIYDAHLGDYERAYHYYQVAENMGFNNQGNAGARYWRLLELARQLGHYEEAVAYGKTVIREYSRSGRAYEAKLLLEDIREERPEMEFTIPELKSFNELETE